MEMNVKMILPVFYVFCSFEFDFLSFQSQSQFVERGTSWLSNGKEDFNEMMPHRRGFLYFIFSNCSCYPSPSEFLYSRISL